MISIPQRFRALTETSLLWRKGRNVFSICWVTVTKSKRSEHNIANVTFCHRSQPWSSLVCQLVSWHGEEYLIIAHKFNRNLVTHLLHSNLFIIIALSAVKMLYNINNTNFKCWPAKWSQNIVVFSGDVTRSTPFVTNNSFNYGQKGLASKQNMPHS